MGTSAITCTAVLLMAATAALADNNLVTTLLNIPRAQDKAYTFANPRDGWIFTSIDGGESMRWAKAGEQEVTGLDGKTLIVRAIPEIIHSGLGYRPSPWLESFPRYSVAYLEKIGAFKNCNVILERKPDPDFDIQEWKASGRQIRVRASSVEAPAAKIYDYWANHRGMQDPYDGIQISEYDGWKGSHHLADYHFLIDAAKKISEDPRYEGKKLVPYTVAMYNGTEAIDFLNVLFKYGHYQACERYIPEQSSMKEAKDQLHWMNWIIAEYRKKLADSQRNSILALGYMSAPPETLDRCPNANYMVFMEMQMRAIATEPTYKGLYGVMWYHSAYASEEAMRWSIKLLRHYCIEGRSRRLSNDPYILRHLKNGDFANKTVGWKLDPANPGAGESGSMAVKSHEGMPTLQTRYTAGEQGKTFLWTKRSADKPNVFSQEIRSLKPGRTYSLKMMVSDYQDLMQFRDNKYEHKPMVSIEGVEMMPAQSFRQAFRSGLAGHSYEKFDRKTNLWTTYHRLVFRAKASTAKLTISDWQSLSDPGGPIGQELTFNYIGVQPYLEE